MDSLIGVIILVTIAAHVLLMIYALIRRPHIRAGWGLLTLAIILSAGSNALHFWTPGTSLPYNFNQSALLTLTLAALTVVYGTLAINDVLKRVPRLWPVAGVLWLIALVVAVVTSPEVTISQSEWLAQFILAPSVLGGLLLGGLGVIALILLAVCFYGFYIALLPEVANRSLFWVLNASGLILGVLLAISGSTMLYAVGELLIIVTLISATYGLVSYRVFDIRAGMTAAVWTIFLIAITAALVFSLLTVAQQTYTENTNENLLVMLFLALLVSTGYVVVGQLLRALLYRFRVNDPTRAARRFSQQVSKAQDLNQLLDVAAETLNSVMGVRRSGMLLVNDTTSDGSRLELLLMRSTSSPEMKDMRGYIAIKGPIYEQLAARHLPVAQFDIEFSPDYVELTPEERDFFRSLQMSAYAPIVVENSLLGILMCGPKTTDVSFYERDLEMLATMADQTGVALRNARSMADLRHLNTSMRVLNAEMEEANEQLEKLDSVKTDFITIASHELRTPLAQIRGYTDIIDALNEQGMLDKDQISGMVANLRKATERTETLIADMLFVSQLDVDAMDLRMAQTTPESVLRMAIEPLTDPLNQRKLSLSARGLRGLPTIYADMQRLVQAFRNIVVNAIKFTPDRGRIEINAILQPATNEGDVDHILVAISDTGVGINSDNLELIFEKFYRAYDPGLHSTGTYKFMGAGPGLGLTIAKGVVESHGGKIWAESSGHNMETFPGTTFYVLLPVVPPEDTRRVLIDDNTKSSGNVPALPNA